MRDLPPSALQRVPLQPGLPDGTWACLRELCGEDETAFAGGRPATDLLDRLLVESPGSTVRPGVAWTLAVCDRDRLLAAVYRRHFGDHVSGSARCARCGEDFEIGFELSALQTSLTDAAEGVTGPDAERLYQLADGRRFRLPTAADERAVRGLDPHEAEVALLQRCVVEGSGGDDPQTVQAAMEAVGPTLDLELEGRCPACDTAREVRFDIQAHLLSALAFERRWLTREVHCIASAYGWSLREIMSLPRSDRRAYVRLIAAGRAEQRR